MLFQFYRAYLVRIRMPMTRTRVSRSCTIAAINIPKIAPRSPCRKPANSSPRKGLGLPKYQNGPVNCNNRPISPNPKTGINSTPRCHGSREEVSGSPAYSGRNSMVRISASCQFGNNHSHASVPPKARSLARSACTRASCLRKRSGKSGEADCPKRYHGHVSY